jgi:hypothetical protein
VKTGTKQEPEETMHNKHNTPNILGWSPDPGVSLSSNVWQRGCFLPHPRYLFGQPASGQSCFYWIMGSTLRNIDIPKE